MAKAFAGALLIDQILKVILPIITGGATIVSKLKADLK
jgi:hypothetical protein